MHRQAIGSSGHLPGTRLPRITDLALFLLEFEPEVAVPYVPRALLRAALAPYTRDAAVIIVPVRNIARSLCCGTKRASTPTTRRRSTV